MRVLACIVAETLPRLRSVLSDVQLHVARDIEEALRYLKRQEYDLLVVGMLFDESRGLELIRRIRADAALKPPPIVGVRGGKTPVPLSPQVFDFPMWALGACDVIDFGAIPNNEAGNRAIHERLTRCARR